VPRSYGSSFHSLLRSAAAYHRRCHLKRSSGDFHDTSTNAESNMFYLATWLLTPPPGRPSRLSRHHGLERGLNKVLHGLTADGSPSFHDSELEGASRGSQRGPRLWFLRAEGWARYGRGRCGARCIVVAGGGSRRHICYLDGPATNRTHQGTEAFSSHDRHVSRETGLTRKLHPFSARHHRPWPALGRSTTAASMTITRCSGHGPGGHRARDWLRVGRDIHDWA